MSLVKLLILHIFFLTGLCLLAVNIFGPNQLIPCIIGGVLSATSVVGLSWFSSQSQAKKGVALALTGSVLRYGFLMLLFVVAIWTKSDMPLGLLTGYVAWMPTILVSELLKRKEKNGFL